MQDDPFCLLKSTIGGSYRVERAIWEGPAGVVYRGIELGSRFEVAITCVDVPASLDAAARSQIARNLARETLVTRRLAPADWAIVRVRDVATARSRCRDWFPYVVREWLEGESLATFADRLSPRARPLDWTLALLEPVALTLGRAHAFRFVHGAVRPESLLMVELGGAPRPVLLDFGTISALAQSPRLLSVLGPERASRLCDPRYAAPELLDPRLGRLGPWTDVFGLALLVSELLLGRPALEGGSALEWAIAARNPLRRPTPRTLGVKVPDHVERALARALSPEPSERFPSASIFWSALRG